MVQVPRSWLTTRCRARSLIPRPSAWPG